MEFAKNGIIIGEIDNVRVSPDVSLTPSMGTTMPYKLKKNGSTDWLNRGAIVLVLSALAGTGGTFNRFVNAVALYLYNKWKLHQGGKPQFTAYLDAVHQSLKHNKDQDFYSALSQQLVIGWQATRNTLGASSQTLVIPLSILFGIFAKPLDISLFGDDLSDYTDTFIAPTSSTSWNLKDSGKYINHGLKANITKIYYDKVLILRFNFAGWVNILSGTATGNDFFNSFAIDHSIDDSEYKRYHGLDISEKKMFNKLLTFLL